MQDDKLAATHTTDAPEGEAAVKQMLKDAQAKVAPIIAKERDAENLQGLGQFRMGEGADRKAARLAGTTVESPASDDGISPTPPTQTASAGVQDYAHMDVYEVILNELNERKILMLGDNNKIIATAVCNALESAGLLPSPNAAPSPPMMAWQPMDSAPRDGTHILVAVADIPHAVSACWQKDSNGGYGWACDEIIDWVQPTHWQNLPTPPGKP